MSQDIQDKGSRTADGDVGVGGISLSGGGGRRAAQCASVPVPKPVAGMLGNAVVQ